MPTLTKSPLDLEELNSLSTTKSAEDVIDISLNKIKLTADQTRSFIDPDELAKLAESIELNGLQIPILVRPIKNKRTPYELVFGFQRLTAHKKLKLDSIKAIVRELSREEALEAQLIENLQRTDLTPINETEGIIKYLCLKSKKTQAEIVKALYKIKRDKNGLNAQPIAQLYDKVGKRAIATFVTDYLPILKMDEKLLKLVRQGKIYYHSAKVIHRIKDEQLKTKLLEFTLNSDLFSYDVLRKLQTVGNKAPEFAIELGEQLYRGKINTSILMLLASHEDPQIARNLLAEIAASKKKVTLEEIKEKLAQTSPFPVVRSEAQQLFKKLKDNRDIWSDQGKVEKLQALLSEIEQLL